MFKVDIFKVAGELFTVVSSTWESEPTFYNRGSWMLMSFCGTCAFFWRCRHCRCDFPDLRQIHMTEGNVLSPILCCTKLLFELGIFLRVPMRIHITLWWLTGSTEPIGDRFGKLQCMRVRCQIQICSDMSEHVWTQNFGVMIEALRLRVAGTCLFSKPLPRDVRARRESRVHCSSTLIFLVWWAHCFPLNTERPRQGRKAGNESARDAKATTFQIQLPVPARASVETLVWP